MTKQACIVCGEIAESLRCDQHRGEHEADRRPDRDRKTNGAKWQRISKRVRQMMPWCLDCGRTTDLTADHIVPVAARPDLEFELANLTTRCRPCNAVKGDTMPDAATVAAVEREVAASRLRRTRGVSPPPDVSRTHGKADFGSHTPGGYL